MLSTVPGGSWRTAGAAWAGDVSATGRWRLPLAGSGWCANLMAGVCTTPLPTWRELMLAYSTYRDAFHRDAAALAAAARRGLAAPVPSCPGWTVATLVTHLTGIYAHRIKLVRVRARENVVQAYEDLDLPAEYQDWFDTEGEDLSTMPPGLLDLFERTAAELEAVLWSVEP